MPLLLFYLTLPLILIVEEAGVFLLPGDISLVAAGVVLRRNGLSPLPSWGLATVAMVTGASVLFVLVRRFHVTRCIVPLRLSEPVDRHGAAGIAFARLVPGLRNGSVVAAASSPLSYRRFLKGVVPTALGWCGLLIGLGYVGGSQLLALFTSAAHTPAFRLMALGSGCLAMTFVIVRVIMHQRARAAAPA